MPEGVAVARYSLRHNPIRVSSSELIPRQVPTVRALLMCAVVFASLGLCRPVVGADGAPAAKAADAAQTLQLIDATIVRARDWPTDCQGKRIPLVCSPASIDWLR